jgi:hypothetical protein
LENDEEVEVEVDRVCTIDDVYDEYVGLELQ